MDRKDKEKLLLLLREKRRREDQLKELYESTNDLYIPLYNNMDRYLVLMGGGGSGKSIFCGKKILHRLTTEKGHRILVVRKVARTLRESTFTQLRSQISEGYDYKDFEINKTDMKIIYKPNKSELIFAGLDDVEKLKSIFNITSIWIEEANELEIGDYRQLDIRLRGQTTSYKQIIFSFNPVSITHWLKAEFFNEGKKDCLTVHSTYKDNKFLDKEAITVLESFKDTDPYYYMVYCLGEWGTLSKTIFDSQKVSERLSSIRGSKPTKQGEFVYEYINQMIVDSSIKWVDDVNGYIKIYEDTREGYPYVIGGDTSGDGSDSFIGQVINNVSGRQVCTLKHQFDEDLYTKQMYCLGKYYNNALIGIESNFSTYPIMELTRLGYLHQYNREVTDTYTGSLEKKYGFKTTSLTRPIILANLVQIVREEVSLFNDLDTLSEMLTFVRNEKGKACAQEGSHDDCIMAMAITYYIKSQQTFEIIIKKEYEPSTLWMFNNNDDYEDKQDYISW